MAELGELKVPAPSPRFRTRSAARRGGEATALGAAGRDGRVRLGGDGLQGCARAAAVGSRGCGVAPGAGPRGRCGGEAEGVELSPRGAEAQEAGTRAVAACCSRYLQGRVRRGKAALEAQGRVHQAERCGIQGET